MILTLSQVSSLNSPFDRDLEDFAGAGCTNVEVWLTKLETYLQTQSLKDVRCGLDSLKQWRVHENDLVAELRQRIG